MLEQRVSNFEHHFVLVFKTKNLLYLINKGKSYF